MFADSTGTARDFFVTAGPEFSGTSFSVFSPQTLTVEQGNQVNLTVRNMENQTFQLQIEGQATVAIQAGTQNGSAVTPVDTAVPLFTASTSGIFNFFAINSPEMNGQIVVLPTDWVAYNPSAQTRSFTQLVLPDFAGEGYDKFFPGIMVVNQGDTVNLTVRNTDDMPHGFALAAYGIDAAVQPGQDLSDGTIAPEDTSIQPFIASTAGVFRFLCTVPCGPGHWEMEGSLIVLPTGGSQYTPDPVTQYSYLTIKPDVAGEGFDKYLPDTIFANQNDLVYIKVRNTDTVAHGFSLPTFSINNQSIAAATGNASTDLIPTDTYLTEFYVSQPGIYEFFCSNNCGAGHDQMIGYIVVLPTLNITSVSPNPTPTQTPSQPMSPLIFAGLGIALLAVGILIGIIFVTRFNKEQAVKTV